ncbi:hypothetical protein CAAN1_04S04016 [[Candida] anglica]|uniref:Putative transcription factor kapC n=1 Tax=[Candida] anglica TaxID=148631 RepID=A0ABP0EDC0_9ASCO
MNTGFGTWTEKDIKDGGQIDPTFGRHQDTDFPTVEDVTAAAVANAQQQNQANQELHDQHHEHQAALEEAKKRRPVSGTKRAAQNRSAQKAFRVRKEKYIKDLEQQAAEANQLKQTIEELRAENLQLRDYTLALQSRVIELSPSHPPQGQDHVPAPPAAVFSGNKMFNQEK